MEILKTKDLIIAEKLVKKVVNMYRAVDHPLRLTILVFIQQHQPIAVTTIYKALSLVQADCSLHLGILRRAAIVAVTQRGRSVLYSINYENLVKLADLSPVFLEKKHPG